MSSVAVLCMYSVVRTVVIDTIGYTSNVTKLIVNCFLSWCCMQNWFHKTQPTLLSLSLGTRACQNDIFPSGQQFLFHLSQNKTGSMYLFLGLAVCIVLCRCVASSVPISLQCISSTHVWINPVWYFTNTAQEARPAVEVGCEFPKQHSTPVWPRVLLWAWYFLVGANHCC